MKKYDAMDDKELLRNDMIFEVKDELACFYFNLLDKSSDLLDKFAALDFS